MSGQAKTIETLPRNGESLRECCITLFCSSTSLGGDDAAEKLSHFHTTKLETLSTKLESKIRIFKDFASTIIVFCDPRNQDIILKGNA